MHIWFRSNKTIGCQVHLFKINNEGLLGMMLPTRKLSVSANTVQQADTCHKNPGLDYTDNNSLISGQHSRNVLNYQHHKFSWVHVSIKTYCALQLKRTKQLCKVPPNKSDF